MVATRKSSRSVNIPICSLKIEHAESLGGWHKVALEQFRNLGSALDRHTGQDEGEKTGHLVKRLNPAAEGSHGDGVETFLCRRESYLPAKT